jgi:hypothetical protein
MRARLGLVLIAPIAASLAAFGCSSNDSDGAISAESQVHAGDPTRTMSDLDLAKKAALLLNGDGAKCNQCHTAGHDDVAKWGAAYKSLNDACLDPALTLSPMERVDCLREDPADPTSAFSAHKLGLHAAGAGLASFQNLFKAAFPADQWEAKFKDFLTTAGMPAFNKPAFSADEYQFIKAWADRGLPQIDAVLGDVGQIDCTPQTSPELADHMTEMATDGWGARLADQATPMALCGAETDPTKCLTSRPDITAQWGVEGTNQKLRELRKLSFNTSFWVRSSADGRFASFGGSPSRIVDLTAPDTDTPISVSAPYDPGWFPNNDGFSFAGTSGGITVCRTSVVLNALATTKKITFNEPTCTPIISTVYQSVGAALDGSVFFMVTGTHTNDSGDNSGPLSASFGANATTTVSPMFNDGTKYVKGQQLTVKVPNEGDQQMSPSNTLLITRFGQKAGKAGYHIRSIKPTLTPPAAGSTATTPTVTVQTKIIGTACLQGGKPQLSFNERFLAVHQYVDPAANPEHLPSDSSNIFINDLKTGKTIRITNMAKNQRALYPHWRADGWLYFLVRDDNTNKETFVASDAALHMAEQ